MTRSYRILRRMSMLLLLTCSGLTLADAFEVTRATIDSGGVLHSTGGVFELSGTLGQPDAGSMTGGPFELNGGFWFPLVPTDCNEDGIVSLLDYGAFATCLIGPVATTDVGCMCYDVDRSGAVDIRDFAQLQAAFAGS